MPRFGVVVLLILLMVLQPVSNSELLDYHQQPSSPKNSGVDLSSTDVSISYSNPGDESQYKMFSSNHPILMRLRPFPEIATDTFSLEFVKQVVSKVILAKNMKW